VGLMRFALFGVGVTNLCIVEVEFLRQPVPRACHGSQPRLVFGRICEFGKPKIVFGVSAKTVWH